VARSRVFARCWIISRSSRTRASRGGWRTRFPSASPPASLDSVTDLDKGHGRIEERAATLAREIDRLSGDKHFPGELRLPGVATIIKVAARTELKDRGRFDTRYRVSSAILAGWADHDLAAILKAEAR
jgi:hypothetical protein